MSVTAPSPPEREVLAASAGERTPELPPVLELLIASRPERERRAVALAIAGAIALHLLLILLFITLGPLGGKWGGILPVATGAEDSPIAILLPGTVGSPRPRAPAAGPAREQRLVTPTRVPSGIPPVPAPGAEPGARNGQGGQGAGAGAAPGGAAQPGAGGGYNAAEALRPHSWDRRLWEPPEALLPTESDADRVAGRIQDRLDAVNDTAAALAEAARKGKDWTIKDKNGNSWGIGPDGKLKLGGLNIPILSSMSYQFQTPPGRREGARHEQANWEAIQRSASQAEIRHTFDERVKAIRERKEKERQEPKKQDETAAQP